MIRKNKKILLVLGIVAIVLVGTGAAVFLKTAYVVPVLMYHSIDYNDKLTKLSVSPESFARQMEFLHRNHYNVISLNEVVEYISKKKKPPHRAVAITFDDGYYNNYRYAYPVLKKYNFPATIFVITDFIGRNGYMGWSQLKEMSDSGLITIGSHTRTHVWLPSIGKKRLQYELKGSREVLEKHLGKKVEELCYPVGAFDEKVIYAAREAGYVCAVTTNPKGLASKDDVYAIRRIKISRTSDNLFVFWVETSGYYTWVKEHRDD